MKKVEQKNKKNTKSFAICSNFQNLRLKLSLNEGKILFARRYSHEKMGEIDGLIKRVLEADLSFAKFCARFERDSEKYGRFCIESAKNKTQNNPKKSNVFLKNPKKHIIRIIIKITIIIKIILIITIIICARLTRTISSPLPSRAPTEKRIERKMI